MNVKPRKRNPTFHQAAGLAVLGLFAAFFLTGCGQNEPDAPDTSQGNTRQFTSPEQPDGLIRRKTLFGNPVQYQGRISPDGAKVSWLALSGGALNLFVADAQSHRAPTQYTFGKDGVEFHRWTPNSAYILYASESAETRTTRVFALNVQTGAVRDLVPVRAGDNVWLKDVSKNWPNSALVRLRRAGQSLSDLYRINLESGNKTRVTENPGYANWVTDSDFTPRLGIKNNPDGSQSWIALDANRQETPLLSVNPQDVSRTQPLQMDATSSSLYLIDGRSVAYSSFERIDLETGEREVLATGQDGDIENALFHPITGEPLAYLTNGAMPHWQALSAGFQPILDRLENALGPRFFILAATNTAEQIVVYSDRPEHPGTYSLYDLNTDTITTLFETIPALERWPLAPSTAMTIRARDGFELVSYFTPANTDNPTAAPLVVIPQPWIHSRVYYGFDPRIQWLSNRGYNVLEVNTRGATGLGRAYAQAGTGKGILLAKTDLADAVKAVLEKSLADKTRIAGFGWGFGGRTLLDAAAINATPLRCVLVMDPILDVADSLKRSRQKKSQATLERWLNIPAAMPDPELITAISPMTHARQIRAQTLILQSNTNKILDQNITRDFVKTIRGAGGEAAMIYFSEIDENLYGQPAFIPFAALAENFLANCLGGKAEPLGDVLDALTFEVNAGPKGIAGVELR